MEDLCTTNRTMNGSSEETDALQLSVNDEELETQAVLAGHVIGLLTGVAAAAHIRSGRLVPLLTEHVDEEASAFVYYGSRTAQPARVRAFIDLAVSRLGNNRDFVLTAEELAAAESKGRAAVQLMGAR